MNSDTSVTISKRQILVRYFKPFYSIISISLLFPGLIWTLFIFIGYLKAGHLPVRGDIEVVSFEGLDRFLVIIALFIYLFGAFIWAFLCLMNFFLNLKANTWTNFIIGLVGIGLAFFISLSAQFDWLLD